MWNTHCVETSHSSCERLFLDVMPRYLNVMDEAWICPAQRSKWESSLLPLIVPFPTAALRLNRRSQPGSTATKSGSSPQSGALWELRRHRSDTPPHSRTTISVWPLTVNWSPRRIKKESRRWPMKAARPLTNRQCTSTGRTTPLKKRCLWHWFTKMFQIRLDWMYPWLYIYFTLSMCVFKNKL